MANQISGTNNDDTLTGTSGEDNISARNGDDYVEALGSNDTVRGNGGADTLFGGDGDDSLVGGNQNDSVSGDAGADTVLGGNGDDTVAGGIGDDLVDGGNDNDVVSGGDGSDTLYGGSGDDSITGGDDNDTLEGNSGADTLEGGGGNDFIEGASQDDQIWGDDGADTIDGGSDDDLISGGQGADSLVGSFGNDTIFGGGGDDTIDAINGNDWVEGGAGDDLIELGGYSGGSDTVIFGPGFGHDTLDGFNPDTDIIHVGGLAVEDGILTATADPKAWVLTIDGVPNASLTLDFGFYWDSGLSASDLLGQVINDTDAPLPTDPYGEPICLTAGCLVDTARGAVRAANLRDGDLVRTLDAGLQPIRAVLRRTVTKHQMLDNPSLRPIRIAQGALGGGKPVRDIHVSRQHCFLATARNDPDREALIRAAHLVDLPGTAEGVNEVMTNSATYVHLLLDGHHLIRSEGVWTETIFTGPRAVAADPLLVAMTADQSLPYMAKPARPILTRADLRVYADWIVGRRRGAAARNAAA